MSARDRSSQPRLAPAKRAAAAWVTGGIGAAGLVLVLVARLAASPSAQAPRETALATSPTRPAAARRVAATEARVPPAPPPGAAAAGDGSRITAAPVEVRAVSDDGTLTRLGIRDQEVTIRDPQDPAKTKVIRVRATADGRIERL
jgi:hypothetical protein